MAIEIKQQLKLGQQLVMTPQLQQAIKLLQLNRMELVEVINQELVENPMLEESAEGNENQEMSPDEVAATEGSNSENSENVESMSVSDNAVEADMADAKTAKDDVDWESYIDDVNSNYSQMPTSRISTDDLPSFENMLTKSTSLEEHLLWQLSMLNLTDDEKKLGQTVIGNLNDDGYLIGSLEDMAKEAGLEFEDAEEILKMIQKFDPVGVASRTVQECLMNQIEIIEDRSDIVLQIIRDHLSDLEKRNYQAICKAVEADMAEVVEATMLIRELEPKPGRLFIETDNTQYITPDIYVYKGKTGEYVITMNEDGLPKLRVSSYYKNVLANAAKEAKTGVAQGKVTKDYIEDKLKSAIWLIKSIHTRQKTIFKVSESIVKHQKDFFEKGVSFLKPMILKDVANDIGMHESTVSRVTTNKFMHTPVGIFELKYFFNTGISASDGGNDVASEAVKEKIKNLVTKEDGKRPLSDQRIVELLKADNIDIARRTVAKYRDMLGILSSSKRKKPF